jgi:predicted porin
MTRAGAAGNSPRATTSCADYPASSTATMAILPHSCCVGFGVVELALGYWITPALKFSTPYQYIHGAPVGEDGAGRVTYHEADLSLDYYLSKRTDVYALLMAQQASGKDSTGQTAVAQLWALSATSTNRRVGTVVGLRHKF